jgi:hypothetical protein
VGEVQFHLFEEPVLTPDGVSNTSTTHSGGARDGTLPNEVFLHVGGLLGENNESQRGEQTTSDRDQRMRTI